MPLADALVLAVLLFGTALLYSSVGQAGASGYLAAMGLYGLAPDVMKPTALVLNILVASIATVQFARAGHFSWPGLWPFLVGSIPLAFVGGAIQLGEEIYRPLVGVVLVIAAARLGWSSFSNSPARETDTPVPVGPAIASGGGIGLLSGLTGTGGGIFLSPLLLFTGWGTSRQAAGVAAAFILANSIAGLAGNLASVRELPSDIPLWAVAVIAGGLIGSALGSQRLGSRWLYGVLAVVLLIAGLRMIFA